MAKGPLQGELSSAAWARGAQSSPQAWRDGDEKTEACRDGDSGRRKAEGPSGQRVPAPGCQAGVGHRGARAPRPPGALLG